MDAAASIIAIVDMTAKVATLLFQYSKEVKNAREDIDRVRRQVDGLKKASESVQQLLKGPNGSKLQASKNLDETLRSSLSQLGRLQQRLDPGKTRKTMSRVGIRALKWPFDSNDIAKIIQDLDASAHAISLGLQADQTYAAPSPSLLDLID